MEHFGYGEQDFIPCEMCGRKAVDIHHLDRRGIGGSKNKDYIENLAAVCRECHENAERDNAFNCYLVYGHKLKLARHWQETGKRFSYKKMKELETKLTWKQKPSKTN